MRQTGTIRNWNDQKGFGFIRPDANRGNEKAKDVFCHRSNVRGLARGQGLKDGTRVEYDTEASEKGPRAVDVVELR